MAKSRRKIYYLRLEGKEGHQQDYYARYHEAGDGRIETDQRASIEGEKIRKRKEKRGTVKEEKIERKRRLR